MLATDNIPALTLMKYFIYKSVRYSRASPHRCGAAYFLSCPHVTGLGNDDIQAQQVYHRYSRCSAPPTHYCITLLWEHKNHS